MGTTRTEAERIAEEELAVDWVLLRDESRRLVFFSEHLIFVLVALSTVLYIGVAGWALSEVIHYHTGATASVKLTVEDKWVEQTSRTKFRSSPSIVDAYFYRVGFVAFNKVSSIEIGDLRQDTSLYRAVHNAEPIKVMLRSDGTFILAQTQATKQYLSMVGFMFLFAFVAGLAGNKQGQGSGWAQVGAAICLIFCFIALMRALFVADWMAASSTWDIWIPCMILLPGVAVAATCYAVYFKRTARVTKSQDMSQPTPSSSRIIN